jgi:predicted membrane-bound spermidine synthase
MLPPVPTLVRSFEEAGQRLTLRDLGTHYELLLGQVPILSSKALATERAFGELVRAEGLGPAPRVLLGGLGFGATLAALLAATGPEARVLVVEKLATVIELLRHELSHLAPGALDDARVKLHQEDVADVIARERDLDAILLDVDNGPQWASFRTNARLYGPEGLKQARDALRPGGLFAVWSGYPADGFLAQLRRAGLSPSAIPLLERGAVRARAYVGRRPEPEERAP